MGQSYLLRTAKNIQVSIAKNVNIITYDTNTRNISFMAGLDKIANKTAINQKHAHGKKRNGEKLDKKYSASGVDKIYIIFTAFNECAMDCEVPI